MDKWVLLFMGLNCRLSKLISTSNTSLMSLIYLSLTWKRILPTTAFFPPTSFVHQADPPDS